MSETGSTLDLPHVLITHQEAARMVPGDLIEWGKAVAIFGGVTIGIYAVFSPAYVWHTKQTFGAGGGILCGVGAVLIVASLFHNIVLSGPFHFGLKFSELEKTLAEANRTVARLNTQLSHLAEVNADVAKSNAQVADLRNQLEQIRSSSASVAGNTSAMLKQLDSLSASVKSGGSGSHMETVPYIVKPAPNAK